MRRLRRLNNPGQGLDRGSPRCESATSCGDSEPLAGWTADRVPSGEVHVVPVGDAIEHRAHDCPCGPTSEAVFREDGSNGWLETHHRVDAHYRLAAPVSAGEPKEDA